MDQRKPVSPAAAPGRAAQDAAPPQAEGQYEAPPTGASASSLTGLTPVADSMISRQLRAIYDEVVNEPIPDQIMRLLGELERKQAGKS